jgi:predicted tellurium resistance membrane protein TerC
MIGTPLMAEALEFEVPKGFVYFAMYFSLGVVLFHMRYDANLRKHESAAETG